MDFVTILPTHFVPYVYQHFYFLLPPAVVHVFLMFHLIYTFFQCVHLNNNDNNKDIGFINSPVVGIGTRRDLTIS